MSKYHIFSGGEYLGTINQTLRVTDVSSGLERHTNALQTLINQFPVGLLIMPDGEHKKSMVTTLAEIAPTKVPSKVRKSFKKSPSNTNGRGSHFSKNAFPKNNGLRLQKTRNFEKSKSGDMA